MVIKTRETLNRQPLVWMTSSAGCLLLSSLGISLPIRPQTEIPSWARSSGIPCWNSSSTLTLKVFFWSDQDSSVQPELHGQSCQDALTGTHDYCAGQGHHLCSSHRHLCVNQSILVFISTFEPRPENSNHLSLRGFPPKLLQPCKSTFPYFINHLFLSKGKRCLWILSKYDLSGHHFFPSSLRSWSTPLTSSISPLTLNLVLSQVAFSFLSILQRTVHSHPLYLLIFPSAIRSGCSLYKQPFPLTYSLSNTVGSPHSAQLLCKTSISDFYFSFLKLSHLWVSLSLDLPPVSQTMLILFIQSLCFPEPSLTHDYM